MKPGTVLRAYGSMEKKSDAVPGSEWHDLPENHISGKIPKCAEVPAFSLKTHSAISEARRISRDPGVRGYSSMEDLKAALES